jgi:DnaJ family protein B protein 12
MEVNKEQAEKCKTIGANALKQGQYDRAVKFFKKSLHLHPLPGVEALLTTAERMAKGESSSSGANTNANTNSSSANGASYSTNSSFGAGASSSSASSASARPAPAPASAPAPATESSGGRSYTPQMVETVERIMKAKEGGRGAHYRVLGISSDATENEIKKAYRKTAIKVHPDKNAAPKADEAFKAVGLAYATLSDPQKRTIYDRYGEEDPDNRGGGMGGMRRGPGGMHFRPGQEVNPEDIFNMFFGGGMGGGMHRGPGGVHFTTNFGGGMPGGFRYQQQRRQAQQQHQQQQETPGLANLIQLLPFLIIMLVSFFNMDNGYSTGSSSTTTGSSRSPGLNRYFALHVSQCLLLVRYDDTVLDPLKKLILFCSWITFSLLPITPIF